MQITSALPAKDGALAPVPGQLDTQAFLTLLVAQLRSQNPLDPMNPTEFVGQLVQFSSLEQLIRIRQSLDIPPAGAAAPVPDAVLTAAQPRGKTF